MLRITLAINDKQIADYEVKRVTGLERRPGPDDVNQYEVREIPSDQLVLDTPVHHRYGAGARCLAAVVLTRIARVTASRTRSSR